MDWHEYFCYDETSPCCLRWRTDRYNGKKYRNKHVSAGDVVGCQNKKGYWTFTLDNKHLQVHRVIAEMLIRPLLPDEEIDHINKDKGDNRVANLRIVERTINLRNKGRYSNNKTGVNGVCINVKKYKGVPVEYVCARWYDIDNILRGKHFRIDVLGYDQAFQLACEYREKMIAQLNEQGAGYTDTHGK